jgi:hypothetical protein
MDLMEENNLDELDNEGALLDDALFDDDLAVDDDDLNPVATVDEDELLDEEEEILDELDLLAEDEEEEGFDLYNDTDDY